MGLDMYARRTKRKLRKDVDFKDHENDEPLHYWRKHPNLHGWMEMLYRLKGGKADEFNLATVQLTGKDIDCLEEMIQKNQLPFTIGFFFGESDGSEAEDDLLFIDEARASLAEGYKLYYASWW